MTYLTRDKLFGGEDPLFPKTLNGQDENKNFVAVGLSHEHWADAATVRTIFRAAYRREDLPYFPPHSVRNTLTQLAYKLNLTPEQLKAWSQNIGHDQPLTTLTSYGHVSTERQGEIIGGLGQAATQPATDSHDMAEKITEILAILKAQGKIADGVACGG
ncbi:MAG: hypothetical protein FJX22_00160 [Alphaproteobacteria bacterium]|nr:hypothetical protein [Alphaproteobacteria bacterium]